MGTRLRRFAGLTGAFLVAIAVPILSSPTAAAAPGPVFGSFSEWAGAGGAYRGTMTLAPGFPVATFVSTSGGSGSGVGPQTGASTWLPAGSPPGAGLRPAGRAPRHRRCSSGCDRTRR